LKNIAGAETDLVEREGSYADAQHMGDVLRMILKVIDVTDKFSALHFAPINGHIGVCRYLAEDCCLDIYATTSNLQKGELVDAWMQPLRMAAQVFVPPFCSNSGLFVRCDVNCAM
jgi:hypothetical protein